MRDELRDEILGHLLEALNHIATAEALLGDKESVDLGLHSIWVDLQNFYDDMDDARIKK